VLTRSGLARAAQQRFGRPGVKRLLRLLSLTSSGAVSGAELRLHRLLRAAGIGGWRAGVRIDHQGQVLGVVDLLFERERVVVEVDGWRSHGSRSAFVQDRQRQNRLMAAGYLVLRFTWDDLEHHPVTVLDRIRQTLRTRRPPPA
jgi:very-short-patch-repair endonuclease